MTPETTLVAPYLYPVDWGFQPNIDEPLPTSLLLVLNFIKLNGETTIPALVIGVRINKGAVRRSTDQLLQRNLIRVYNKTVASNQPRRFFEAIE